MKNNRLTLVCGLSALLAGIQVGTAISADNPYLGTITNRNLFSLKPPPDPATLVPVVQPPPLPDVKLAGITTLMGNTRAILRVMRAAKPPEPAKEVSLFLSPGSPAEDGVQVLDIDVAHGLVKISNSGTPQTLDITKNAPKAAAAPPPATALPVPPPRPGGNVPVPPTPPVPAVTSFSRPMRTGSDGVVGAGPNQMGSASAAETPRIPSNEEQTWFMAMQREKALEDVAKGVIQPGDVPPFPPNEVTDAADREALSNGMGQYNGGNGNTGTPQFPQ